MIDKEKDQMLKIINKYRTDKDYRDYMNSKDISELSEIEQIALRGLVVSSEGVEVVEGDFSNHYDDYNPIDFSTPEALEVTCMNMAIGELLHQAFKDNNIGKYSDFNFAAIKTRAKGDLYSTMDKPDIIRFIRAYNEANPQYLPKHAREFLQIYEGHIKNGIGSSMFAGLAQTFNTNIYLDELLPEPEEKKGFFGRKSSKRW